MANEAVIITLLGNQGDPVEYTVATETALPKGSIMQLSSSPQTASLSSADGQFFAGITAVEKTATDGVTKMALITNCIADLQTTGGKAMILGQAVKIGGANFVETQDETSIIKLAENVGTALETVGATATGAVKVHAQ